MPCLPTTLPSCLLLGALASSVVGADTGGEFPDQWYYYGSRRPAALRALEGRPAPELKLREWIGAPPPVEGHVVVVDFWATWCAPCMRSIRKNNELVARYGPQGLSFIAVHDASRGWQKVPDVVGDQKIAYPVALDDGGVSAAAWKVRFWPTYAVLDRGGTVRAIGLHPMAVEKVVQMLLAETDDESRWLEGTPQQRQRLEALVAEAVPPPIAASSWTTPPLDLQRLRGKVVLLDFWSTDGASSAGELRKLGRLHDAHAGEGLVVILIARPRDGDRLQRLAERLQIGYGLCIDDGRRTTEAYRVDDHPDYYLIDRNGALRVADCKDALVEEAVRALLAEPEPAPPQGAETQTEAATTSSP